MVLRDINIEYGKDDKKLPAEHRSLPAWGLSARHLKNLQLDNVRLTALARDGRPMMILDAHETRKVVFDGIKPAAAGPPELRCGTIQRRVN